jgi:hypothetical protein
MSQRPEDSGQRECAAGQAYAQLETQTKQGAHVRQKGPAAALRRIEAARRAAAGEPEPEPRIEVQAGPDGRVLIRISGHRPPDVVLSPAAARDLADAILGALDAPCASTAP